MIDKIKKIKFNFELLLVRCINRLKIEDEKSKEFNKKMFMNIKEKYDERKERKRLQRYIKML